MGTFAIIIQEVDEDEEDIQVSSKEVLQMTNEGVELMMTSSTTPMEKTNEIVNRIAQHLNDISENIENINSAVQ